MFSKCPQRLQTSSSAPWLAAAPLPAPCTPTSTDGSASHCLHHTVWASHCLLNKIFMLGKLSLLCYCEKSWEGRGILPTNLQWLPCSADIFFFFLVLSPQTVLRSLLTFLRHLFFYLVVMFTNIPLITDKKTLNVNCVVVAMFFFVWQVFQRHQDILYPLI